MKIVYATARAKESASKFLDMFIPDVFIGYGGALALAGDKVLYRFDIPAEISFQLINDCLRETEIKSVKATNETVAYTSNKAVELEASRYKYIDFTVKNNISYLKISLLAKNPDVVNRIALKYPMCDKLRYAGEDMYRFANRNAVKWNAVSAVAKHYNINTDMTVAFGDDINDLEMLRECGFGVAVGNAIDEIKAVANYICDNNDSNGVAKWLEQNVL